MKLLPLLYVCSQALKFNAPVCPRPRLLQHCRNVRKTTKINTRHMPIEYVTKYERPRLPCPCVVVPKLSPQFAFFSKLWHIGSLAKKHKSLHINVQRFVFFRDRDRDSNFGIVFLFINLFLTYLLF